MRIFYSAITICFLLFAEAALAQGIPGEIAILNKFRPLQALTTINDAFADLAKTLQAELPGHRFRIQSGSTMTANDLPNLAAGRPPQMILSAAGYYANAEYGFLLLNTPPFVSADKLIEWRLSDAGVNLTDALYAKQGVKGLPCVAIDGNMDFLTRRPISSEYGLKGTKIAMPAPIGPLYAATSASFFAFPLGELRIGLEKGLIDGAYFWTPHESIEMKLYEAAQAVYAPSEIRPVFVADLMVGLHFWESLPENSRQTITATCQRLLRETLMTSRRRAAAAIEKYRAGGIPVEPLPAEAVAAIRKNWEETAAKRAIFDPVFQSMHKSLYPAN
jgi:TRAP-type mannitol/chloroaromatic compound transport system substrate-binding protein